MEIEIKKIQAELLSIQIVDQITQSEQSIEPRVEEKKEDNEQVLKAIQQFNNLFKK